MHRDIKPENIMIHSINNQIPIIKLIDFGLSKILGNGETSTQPFGTPLYVAPEVVSNEEYSYSVDMYSVGALLYEILCG